MMVTGAGVIVTGAVVMTVVDARVMVYAFGEGEGGESRTTIRSVHLSPLLVAALDSVVGGVYSDGVTIVSDAVKR